MLSDGLPSSDADRERRRAELRRRYRAAATKALDAFLTELYGPDDAVYPDVPATSLVPRCPGDAGHPPHPIGSVRGCWLCGTSNAESSVQHNRHYGVPDGGAA